HRDAEADEEPRPQGAARDRSHVVDEQAQRVASTEGRLHGSGSRDDPVPRQARHDQRDAQPYARGEQAADERVHAIVRAIHPTPRMPRTIISTPSASSTMRNRRCTASLLTRSRILVPTSAPAVTPTMTGAARAVSMSPERR